MGTNPLKTDTDNDGLSDAQEGESNTDPLKADTDDDGYNDGTDKFPLDPNEHADFDQDGLGDNTDPDDDNDDLQILRSKTMETTRLMLIRIMMGLMMETKE